MPKSIAFIPARCGSKSIPFKNIKSFCGKPLIYWSLLAANNAKFIDEVVVATDCDEIASKVKDFDLNKVRVYKRSAENASDTASTESAMLEYISNAGLDDNNIFILIQATTPFITAKNLDEAYKLYQNGNYNSLLTCVRQKRFFWNNNGTPVNYDYLNRPRRQDFNGQLMENGAFYFNTVSSIKQTGNRLSGKIGIYEMPDFTAVEIDEEDDWHIAEMLMLKHILKPKRPAKKIKLFATDVDGVLTDAGMYYTENGDELKKFHTHDGMGIKLLMQAGVKTSIITSENVKLVERRAKKLNIDYLYLGAKDKLALAKEICTKEGISLDEMAYIGDDINDFELLSSVGWAACPANALPKIKNIPGITHISKPGGSGAVREFTEMILTTL